MYKSELKLYFKSKWNVLITLLLLIPVMISYVATFLEKNEWARQLANPASDLNIQKTQQLVEGYSGISYLFNFIFSSDYMIIFILIAIIAFSCMFGAQLLQHRSIGFGNMIVTRCNYSIYLYNMIKAQILYIGLYLTIFFLGIVFLTGLIFPYKFNSFITCNLPLYSYSILECVRCAVSQILLIFLLIINISVFTSLSDWFINNKYIIYSVPLILYFVPFILASTLGNVSSVFERIISSFVVDNNILAIYYHRVSDTSSATMIKDYFFLPIGLLIINIFMYIFNNNRFKERYL